VADLCVTEWGDGERALLVHGSFGWGSETWRRQRPLGERFRLVLVDRRGFGGSTPNGRVDFERDADDLAALLDEPAHVLGHSYGGVASLLAAARRPDGVRSLAVIEPPAFGVARGNPAVETVIERIGRAMAAATDAGDYYSRFLQAFGFPPPSIRLNEAALRAAESSWHERPPDEAVVPVDELARAAFPKLVIRGAWDRAPAEARENAGAAFHAVCDVLEQRLSAEGATFAGAAHRPQELGEPFNRRIAAFWTAT
jgi:pimeloyl-ACP methyl ester carboxylesterase